MSIVTVGIDPAKDIVALDGVDDNGTAVLVEPKASREHLPPLIAQLPPGVSPPACRPSTAGRSWRRPRAAMISNDSG
jgi:hypothetical protein